MTCRKDAAARRDLRQGRLLALDPGEELLELARGARYLARRGGVLQ